MLGGGASGAGAAGDGGVGAGADGGGGGGDSGGGDGGGDCAAGGGNAAPAVPLSCSRLPIMLPASPFATYDTVSASSTDVTPLLVNSNVIIAPPSESPFAYASISKYDCPELGPNGIEAGVSCLPRIVPLMKAASVPLVCSAPPIVT